jgi:hypothetical protein
MRRLKLENARQDHEKSGVVLSSWLVDGDISSASSGRRTRGGAFGISLAFESLILGLLVVTPLLTSITKPQLRPNFPTQLTFFRSGPNLSWDYMSQHPLRTRHPKFLTHISP